MKNLIHKIFRRIWGDIVRFSRNKFYYLYLYRSYWNFLLHKGGKLDSNYFYFSARPNPGAGIGHQMANWIAGYWFSKQFNIKFAHIPFSNTKWEKFLGFGNNEILVSKLLKNGYKKVRLPLFDENNTKEIELINTIISSYSGKKIVFICEQDHFYGTAVNASQGIANQISGQLGVFSAVLMKALNPVITKQEGAGNNELMKMAVFTGSKFIFYLRLVLYVPFIILMEEIFTLWLNNMPPYAIIFGRLLLIRDLLEHPFEPFNIAIYAKG